MYILETLEEFLTIYTYYWKSTKSRKLCIYIFLSPKFIIYQEVTNIFSEYQFFSESKHICFMQTLSNSSQKELFFAKFWDHDFPGVGLKMRFH